MGRCFAVLQGSVAPEVRGGCSCCWQLDDHVTHQATCQTGHRSRRYQFWYITAGVLCAGMGAWAFFVPAIAALEENKVGESLAARWCRHRPRRHDTAFASNKRKSKRRRSTPGGVAVRQRTPSVPLTQRGDAFPLKTKKNPRVKRRSQSKMRAGVSRRAKDNLDSRSRSRRIRRQARTTRCSTPRR